uniref:Tac7077 n=1 Tax=Coix lacryma-jobi TaxID=4505 RepID=K4LZ18_COILA|nr:Tac7077 [Coix lacryma-jobi]
MLNRGAVRSLLHRLRPPLPLGWNWNPGSAMPPPPPTAAAANRACLCRFAHSTARCGESGRTLPGKAVFLNLGAGRRFAPSGALSLRGCLGWQDGGGGGGEFRRRVDGEAAVIKAQVLSTQRQLMRDLELLPLEEATASVKSINGNGACRRGKPLGFPEQAVAAKMVVAVDVDEVLGSFLAALNKFIADRYSWNHSVSEYHVYEFFKIWNCSRERANFLVHEFFTTQYFQDGIHPIPGAQDTLQTLSSFCSLSVVTSRQDVIKNHTLEWIEKYYPGLFEQIHFGNHFALEGQSRPKSEICRSFGAQVLIDDNPRYALECANDGMRVLLFDYDNSYPWCKTGVGELHPLVTKVHNWGEVEEKLLSWVVPDS